MAGTARDLLAESDRMERLVRDLLFLARDDQPAPAPTRWSTSTTWCSRRWPGCARAPRRDRRLGGDRGAAAGHRGDLGRMVRNLLANAARHAAGRVEVACGAGPGRHGGADRLRRRARDRARAPGAGLRAVLARRHGPQRLREHRLGLSIVRAVAERHGGRSGWSTRPWVPGSRSGCPEREAARGITLGVRPLGESDPDRARATQGVTTMTEQVETERRTDQINLSDVAAPR